MRALVKDAPRPGMVLRDVPRPTCGPSDVLIRVHHAGVCGTDLHIWEWDSWASQRLKPPVVIGHEFSGVVEALGREVKGVREGQRVAVRGEAAGNRIGSGGAGAFAPWVLLLEVQVSHRVRTGEWVPLDVEGIKQHASELLLDWCLGALIVGCAVGLLGAALAYPLARARERAFVRREASRATTTPTLGPAT